MDATSSGLSTVEDYYTVAGISAETGVVSSQMSMIRQFFMAALHDQSVQNIGTTEAVVSGGLAEYAPEKTPNFHTVFEQADPKMYQEKQLLKSMGAATRS